MSDLGSRLERVARSCRDPQRRLQPFEIAGPECLRLISL
jgi:hypothetical protein